jgi:hypothetical protein
MIALKPLHLSQHSLTFANVRAPQERVPRPVQPGMAMKQPARPRRHPLCAPGTSIEIADR